MDERQAEESALAQFCLRLMLCDTSSPDSEAPGLWGERAERESNPEHLYKERMDGYG